MRIATRRMPIARRRRGRMPFRTRLRGRMPIGRLSVDAAEPSRGDERDAARAAREERRVAASKRRPIVVGRVALDESRRGDESRASRRAARTPERDFVLVVFAEIHRGDVRAGPRRARGRFRGGDGPRAPERTAPRRVSARGRGRVRTGRARMRVARSKRDGRGRGADAKPARLRRLRERRGGANGRKHPRRRRRRERGSFDSTG